MDSINFDSFEGSVRSFNFIDIDYSSIIYFCDLLKKKLLRFFKNPFRNKIK